jgi:ferredoxin-NADP reductase
VPAAREIICKVVEKTWLTSSVFTLRFEPTRKFDYEPGQFLSIIIDPPSLGRVRRIYSFSSGGKKEGFELCVQLVPGGIGSNYLASLNPGDEFRATAPYGDFTYHIRPDQNVCFISTGTGIAPFKSMVTSQRFREDPPSGAMLLFGARTEQDVLFPGFFEKYGIEVVHAVSRPTGNWNGFRGRVTDFLKALPLDWPWQSTVFYICGNGDMIRDVRKLLQEGRNVPKEQIRYEIYFAAHNQAQLLKHKQAA